MLPVFLGKILYETLGLHSKKWTVPTCQDSFCDGIIVVVGVEIEVGVEVAVGAEVEVGAEIQVGLRLEWSGAEAASNLYKAMETSDVTGRCL